MLARAKKVAALIVEEIAKPVAVVALPHNLRAALADLGAELIEINQRLDKLGKVKSDGES
jgi:hypothetical protein